MSELREADVLNRVHYSTGIKQQYTASFFLIFWCKQLPTDRYIFGALNIELDTKTKTHFSVSFAEFCVNSNHHTSHASKNECKKERQVWAIFSHMRKREKAHIYFMAVHILSLTNCFNKLPLSQRGVFSLPFFFFKPLTYAMHLFVDSKVIWK